MIVMKNNFKREVLSALDASYGFTSSSRNDARQAIRFGAWEV